MITRCLILIALALVSVDATCEILLSSKLYTCGNNCCLLQNQTHLTSRTPSEIVVASYNSLEAVYDIVKDKIYPLWNEIYRTDVADQRTAVKGTTRTKLDEARTVACMGRCANALTVPSPGYWDAFTPLNPAYTVANGIQLLNDVVSTYENAGGNFAASSCNGSPSFVQGGDVFAWNYPWTCPTQVDAVCKFRCTRSATNTEVLAQCQSPQGYVLQGGANYAYCWSAGCTSSPTCNPNTTNLFTDTNNRVIATFDKDPVCTGASGKGCQATCALDKWLSFFPTCRCNNLGWDTQGQDVCPVCSTNNQGCVASAYWNIPRADGSQLTVARGYDCPSHPGSTCRMNCTYTAETFTATCGCSGLWEAKPFNYQMCLGNLPRPSSASVIMPSSIVTMIVITCLFSAVMALF